MPATGYAAPTFTTRSAGTKIVLWPAVDATHVDHAIGTDAATVWNSVSDSASSFKWYAATTNIMSLSGTGNLNLAYAAASAPSRLLIGNNSDMGSDYAAIGIAIPAGATVAPFIIDEAGIKQFTVDTSGNVATA